MKDIFAIDVSQGVTTILCVGDLHLSDRAPVHTMETYTEDILEMLVWIADYAASIGADAVVWAGDVFHHKAPHRNSHELVLKVIGIIRYYASKGVRLLCVTGNHDVSNGIVDHVRVRQPLGVLYEAGLEELNGWDSKLPLFGVPWRETWTEPGDCMKALRDFRGAGSTVIGEEDWVDPEQDPSSSLVVTHAPVFPPHEADKQLFDLVPLEGAEGLSAAMGNVGYLYYGHIHEDHGIFEVDGVTYANMGALSRGSLHEYNIHRQIKIAVWTEEGFTEVVVPHRPATEVFRLAEAIEERQDKMRLDEFLTAVGQSNIEISSTGSVIEHIRSRTDVPPKVKIRAIEILEEVS